MIKTFPREKNKNTNTSDVDVKRITNMSQDLAKIYKGERKKGVEGGGWREGGMAGRGDAREGEMWKKG